MDSWLVPGELPPWTRRHHRAKLRMAPCQGHEMGWWFALWLAPTVFVASTLLLMHLRSPLLVISALIVVVVVVVGPGWLWRATDKENDGDEVTMASTLLVLVVGMLIGQVSVLVVEQLDLHLLRWSIAADFPVCQSKWQGEDPSEPEETPPLDQDDEPDLEVPVDFVIPVPNQVQGWEIVSVACASELPAPVDARFTNKSSVNAAPSNEPTKRNQQQPSLMCRSKHKHPKSKKATSLASRSKTFRATCSRALDRLHLSCICGSSSSSTHSVAVDDEEEQEA